MSPWRCRAFGATHESSHQPPMSQRRHAQALRASDKRPAATTAPRARAPWCSVQNSTVQQYGPTLQCTTRQTRGPTVRSNSTVQQCGVRPRRPEVQRYGPTVRSSSAEYDAIDQKCTVQHLRPIQQTVSQTSIRILQRRDTILAGRQIIFRPPAIKSLVRRPLPLTSHSWIVTCREPRS